MSDEERQHSSSIEDETSEASDGGRECFSPIVDDETSKASDGERQHFTSIEDEAAYMMDMMEMDYENGKPYSDFDFTIMLWGNMFFNCLPGPEKEPPWHFDGYYPDDDIDRETFTATIKGMIERYIEEPEIKNPESEFYLGKTIDKILVYMFGDLDTLFPVSMNKIWIDVIFVIAKVWYETNRLVDIRHIVDLYHSFRGQTFTKDDIGNYLGYKTGRFDRLRIDDTRKFFGLVRRGMWKVEMMWELWDEHDPAVYKEGVGNMTVWFPRETLEDVIALNLIVDFSNMKNRSISYGKKKDEVQDWMERIARDFGNIPGIDVPFPPQGHTEEDGVILPFCFRKKGYITH